MIKRIFQMVFIILIPVFALGLSGESVKIGIIHMAQKGKIKILQ